MKISLKWLNDYISIDDHFENPGALADLLTHAGLEVEGIENKAKDFQHVVVGHILERGQHPNADRLTLCQVSTGQGVTHQIVCGAKNHKAGDRVVVALPGAVLPGDFRIKASAIRGVPSNGMLCSLSELGLAKESEGIVILPEDAPIGKPYAEYMGFDDIVFELKVTPNRADVLSHFGLARELSVLLKRPCRLPLGDFKVSSASSQEFVRLEVRDAESCPRYAGRVLRGVQVGASPDWMKRRLESVGLSSINNVVDVTNYVMMELGQPLHAFDLRDLKGQQLIVAPAPAGEAFTTLDGTKLELDGGELTIRDLERPVALAGIVGGLNSGVKDDTRDLFLECAYFSQAQVRRTSRRYGVETESSYRFARGVNPDAVPTALQRATELILKVAGGEALGGPHDFYPKAHKAPKITLSAEGVADCLGFPVKEEQLIEVLTRLECRVDRGEGPVLSVTPPSYRWDLNREVDLVEEFARLHGYSHIPDRFPVVTSEPGADSAEWKRFHEINHQAVRCGYQQAVNLVFVSSEFQNRLLGPQSLFENVGIEAIKDRVRLVNPLNQDLDMMRVSLVPGLFANLVHNLRHGNEVGRLFESGYVFQRKDLDYLQKPRLAFVAWGQYQSLWQRDAGRPEALLFEVKAHIEQVLRSSGFRKWKWLPTEHPPEFLHPGQTMTLQLQGQNCGFVGALHPSWVDSEKIKSQVVLSEIDLSKWSPSRTTEKIRTPSKFPAVDRDVAFLLKKGVASSDVLAEIRKAAGALLVDSRVFDQFEGGSLGGDEKSVAFRMRLQDSQATLSDEQIQQVQKKVVDAVCQKFGATLR